MLLSVKQAGPATANKTLTVTAAVSHMRNHASSTCKQADEMAVGVVGAMMRERIGGYGDGVWGEDGGKNENGGCECDVTQHAPGHPRNHPVRQQPNYLSNPTDDQTNRGPESLQAW